MSDYLDSYLKILPNYEAEKVKKLIESEKTNLGYINETEFNSILSRLDSLGSVVTKVTEVLPNIDKISRDEFNQFHLGVYVDLQRLYKESELIENAIVSYEHFHQAELNSLQTEIIALSRRIDEIDKTRKVQDKVITRIEDFSSDENIEKNPSLSYMYKDRDGIEYPTAEIKRANNTSRLVTMSTKNTNVLRDEAGRLTATISITDKKGMPVPQTQHPIESALDNSLSTAWAEMVLAEEVVNISMQEGNYTIPAGGTLARVVLKLAKFRDVTELIINPFYIYPMMIAGIFYRTSSNQLGVIIDPDYPIEMHSTEIINFNTIQTNEIIFYFRQKQYTTNTYLVSDAIRSNIWEQISAGEYQVSIDNLYTGSSVNKMLDQDKIDEIDGWKNYISSVNSYNIELQNYIQSYNTWASQVGKSGIKINTNSNPWENNDTDNTGDPTNPDTNNITTIRYRGYYYNPISLPYDSNLTNAENQANIQRALLSYPSYYGIYYEGGTDFSKPYIYVKGKYAYIDIFTYS